MISGDRTFLLIMLYDTTGFVMDFCSFLRNSGNAMFLAESAEDVRIIHC